jgi:hypothetical protein
LVRSRSRSSAAPAGARDGAWSNSLLLQAALCGGTTYGACARRLSSLTFGIIARIDDLPDDPQLNANGVLRLVRSLAGAIRLTRPERRAEGDRDTKSG